MTLPAILTQLERGEISATQAQEIIVGEIERIRDKDVYGDIDKTGNYKICWMGGLDCLKAAWGITSKNEDI